MKTTTPAAKTWDTLWTAYTAARKAGNLDRAEDVKSQMRQWHEAAKTPVPAWLA